MSATSFYADEGRETRRKRLADAFAELQESTRALESQSSLPLPGHTSNFGAAGQIRSSPSKSKRQRASTLGRPTISSVNKERGAREGGTTRRQRLKPRPAAFTPQKNYKTRTPSGKGERKSSVFDDAPLELQQLDLVLTTGAALASPARAAPPGDLTRGYLEGLRISELKSKTMPPARIPDDIYDGDEDRYPPELLESKRLQAASGLPEGGQDLETRTQLMGLYSKWEAKLKSKDAELNRRKRSIEESEAALTGNATKLSESSKKIDYLRKVTDSKVHDVQAWEQELSRAERDVEERESACERQEKYQLDREKEFAEEVKQKAQGIDEISSKQEQKYKSRENKLLLREKKLAQMTATHTQEAGQFMATARAKEEELTVQQKSLKTQTVSLLSRQRKIEKEETELKKLSDV